VQAFAVDVYPYHSLAKLVVVRAVLAEAGLVQVEEVWMEPVKVL